MVYVMLLVINFVKICLSLAIGILSFYPPLLVQEQPKLFGAFSNRSMTIVGQYYCRIPQINVAVSNEEVYDVLNLPSSTLLLGSLPETGKCTAAMHKVRMMKVDKCFCLNSWLIWLIFGFGFVSLMASIFHIMDFVTTARKEYTVTVLDCSDRARKLKFFAFIYVAMLVLMVVQVEYFSESMRYTLPNSIYDRPYFETPLIWQLIIGFCAGYAMLICPIELVYMAVHYSQDQIQTSHTGSSPVVERVIKHTSVAVKPIPVEKPLEKVTVTNVDSKTKGSSANLLLSTVWTDGSEKEECDVKSLVSAHSCPPSTVSKSSVLETAYEVGQVSFGLTTNENKCILNNGDRESVIEIKSPPSITSKSVAWESAFIVDSVNSVMAVSESRRIKRSSDYNSDRETIVAEK